MPKCPSSGAPNDSKSVGGLRDVARHGARAAEGCWPPQRCRPTARTSKRSHINDKSFRRPIIDQDESCQDYFAAHHRERNDRGDDALTQWEGSLRPHAAVFEQLAFLNQVLARLARRLVSVPTGTCAPLLATRDESWVSRHRNGGVVGDARHRLYCDVGAGNRRVQTPDFQRHKYYS